MKENQIVSRVINLLFVFLMRVFGHQNGSGMAQKGE
jgi:hypothetical protein